MAFMSVCCARAGVWRKGREIEMYPPPCLVGLAFALPATGSGCMMQTSVTRGECERMRHSTHPSRQPSASYKKRPATLLSGRALRPQQQPAFELIATLPLPASFFVRPSLSSRHLPCCPHILRRSDKLRGRALAQRGRHPLRPCVTMGVLLLPPSISAIHTLGPGRHLRACFPRSCLH